MQRSRPKSNRPARIVKVLTGTWACAILALSAPALAEPPAARQALLAAPNAPYAPACPIAAHRAGENGGKERAEGQRPAGAPRARAICRLAIAAAVSIRNNPGIF